MIATTFYYYTSDQFQIVGKYGATFVTGKIFIDYSIMKSLSISPNRRYIAGDIVRIGNKTNLVFYGDSGPTIESLGDY